MTLPTKISALAALLFAAALSGVQAQPTQTDELLSLDFQLTTVAQGPTTSGNGVLQSKVIVSEITSRDVVKALGASTGNAFSSKARLMLLTPTNDLQDWTVQVRDGANVVDVTGFFVHQPGAAMVSSAFLVTRTGDAGDTEYTIDSFSLVDQPGFPPLSLHFSVSGLTVTTQSGKVNRKGKVVGQVDDVSASVSGIGDANGALLMIGGDLEAKGTGTTTVTTQPPVTS